MSAPSTDRVEGYDLARAVAITFMVLINFQYYLLARPSGAASEVAPRWIFDLPSGRSSSLFVTLAGCGIALMARGAEGRALWAVRRTLLLRALVLLVAGNLLILAWDIDILHFYAFYLALACVFLRWPARWRLALAAVLVIASGVGASVVDDATFRALEYHSPIGMAADVFVSGVHPVVPWLAFVLVGMCIGELDLRSPAARRRVLLAGASAAVGAELIAKLVPRLALAGVLPLPVSVLRALGTGWSPEPLFVLSTGGTASCAIVLCHVIAERYRGRWLLRALVATGQLSLSIYLLHALAGVDLPAWLFGARRALDLTTVVLYWAAFVALVVVGAYFYRRRFARGPLEALMRALAGAPRGAGARPEPNMEPAPLGAIAYVVASAAMLLALVPVFGLPPSIECAPAAPMRSGESRLIELTLLCPHREIPIELDAPARVAIETSSAIDPYLVLLRGSAVVAEDDDSGPWTDARIEADVDDGLRVRVRPYGATVGPVRVRLERLAEPSR